MPSTNEVLRQSVRKARMREAKNAAERAASGMKNYLSSPDMERAKGVLGHLKEAVRLVEAAISDELTEKRNDSK